MAEKLEINVNDCDKHNFYLLINNDQINIHNLEFFSLECHRFAYTI